MKTKVLVYMAGLFLVASAYLTFLIMPFGKKFDLLGYPVRNDDHGWLGPTPIGSKCLDEIGKVYDWTCEDITVFQNNQRACNIWLRLNGLQPGQ